MEKEKKIKLVTIFQIICNLNQKYMTGVVPLIGMRIYQTMSHIFEKLATKKL